MIPQKGNVRMLFDAIEEIELDAMLERGSAFRAAKARLLDTLQNGAPRLIVHFLPWHGLTGTIVTGVLLDMHPERKKLPWGWRWWRHYDRDCFQAMPLWLWWPRRIWSERWRVVHPAIRLGFFQGTEGGLYSEFRWSWKFWRSVYIADRRFKPSVPHWWYRFGWWCERKEREYYRDVPRPWTPALVPDGRTSGRAQLVMDMQRRIAENLQLTNYDT